MPRISVVPVTVVKAMPVMDEDMPWATRQPQSWPDWPAFRRPVPNMDLLRMAGHPERVKTVTAEGVKRRVPSVGSDAITWAPWHEQAEVDELFEVARAGRHLRCEPPAAGWLASPGAASHAGREGLALCSERRRRWNGGPSRW